MMSSLRCVIIIRFSCSRSTVDNFTTITLRIIEAIDNELHHKSDRLGYLKGFSQDVLQTVVAQNFQFWHLWKPLRNFKDISLS